MNLVSNFITALNEEKVCVHPSDTVPGLTFLPTSIQAESYLKKIKNYNTKKSYVAFVDSFAMAKNIWEPLPLGWEQILTEVWPAPLSVIWKSSAYPLLRGSNNTLALRMPSLSVANQWFYKVLNELKIPLPTTSINEKGGESLILKNELMDYTRDFLNQDFYFPEFEISNKRSKTSTLIEIIDNKSFRVIRYGTFDLSCLEKKYNLTNLRARN